MGARGQFLTLVPKEELRVLVIAGSRYRQHYSIVYATRVALTDRSSLTSIRFLCCGTASWGHPRHGVSHQGSPPISGILTRQVQGMCSPPHQNGQCEKNVSDRETSPLLSSKAEYVLTDRKPHYLFPRMHSQVVWSRYEYATCTFRVIL